MLLPSKGYTLMEILIVIAIIGILSSSLLPAIGNYQNRARETVLITEIHHIGQAANIDFMDFGNWPGDMPPSGCQYDLGGWANINAPRFVTNGLYPLEKWIQEAQKYKSTYCFDWDNWENTGLPGWIAISIWEVGISGSRIGQTKSLCIGESPTCITAGMR